MRTSNFICAFPGTGKTFLANRFPEKVLDLDANGFILLEDGRINKEWPANYIDHAESLAHNYQHVLLPSFQDVTRELDARGYSYTLVCPKLDHVYEYENRFKLNKRDAKFIIQNWEDLVEETSWRGLGKNVNFILLEEQQYLGDVTDIYTTVGELHTYLEWLISIYERNKDLKICVEAPIDGAMGGTNVEYIRSWYQGIDWNHGKLILKKNEK